MPHKSVLESGWELTLSAASDSDVLSWSFGDTARDGRLAVLVEDALRRSIGDLHIKMGLAWLAWTVGAGSGTTELVETGSSGVGSSETRFLAFFAAAFTRESSF